MVQLAGAVLLALGAVMLGLVATAGAAGSPQNGTELATLTAQTPFTAGTPFDSGQKIDVSVPANTVFDGSAYGNNTQGIKILECSAPNGVIPTSTTACDGNTVATEFPAPDGSFDWLNDNISGYPVYYLPDSNLGDSPSGPTCGNTAPTECILYIGNNQGDFTQPHVWSPPFFIHTDPNHDSGTVNPGDGSPPPVANVDATKSKVVAAPTTVTADGADLSTVTVTLLDSTGSVPVIGKTVAVSASTSTATVTPLSPVTDSSGAATFTVSDTVAEPVTLTAKDTTDSVTLATAPTVTFQAPAVSPTHSSVVVNPTTVPTGSTTITVTLSDQASSPQPIAGKAVTLSATGSAAISPTTPVVTDSSGTATFTATDSVTETVTFTATDTTDSVTIANTASATFGTLTVSATKSAVTVASPAPIGPTGTTATVTLLNGSGTPIPGKAVSLQPTAPDATLTIGGPQTTDVNGVASFSVRDTVTETVTLQATDTTDSITIQQEPSVTFAAAGPSASSSNMTAAATSVPADGETLTLITVTLNDQFDNPISGKTISLAGSPNGNVQVHPIAIGGSTPGVTNASGQAQFETDDTVAETVTFTATDTSDNNLVLSKTASITFTAGSAGSHGARVDGDGVAGEPAGRRVHAVDRHGDPGGLLLEPRGRADHHAGGANGSSKVSPSSGVTGATGQATFSVTDSTAEVVTYQATDPAAQREHGVRRRGRGDLRQPSRALRRRPRSARW